MRKMMLRRDWLKGAGATVLAARLSKPALAQTDTLNSALLGPLKSTLVPIELASHEAGEPSGPNKAAVSVGSATLL